MMRGWFAVGLLALGLAGTRPAMSAEVRVVSLGNGLQVLLAPDAGARAVDVAMWYRAGTRYEKPGTVGVSYLFGRLMFRGSKGFPAGEHRRLLEAEGATVNSVTNPDFTCFYQTLPRAAVHLALRLEADRMAALELTQEKVDHELRTAREERRRMLGNPVGRGLEELYALAYSGHPYGYPVIGIEKDLERITLADVEAYYRERFAPQNAVLTVVGDFDPSTTLPLIKRHFEKIPKRTGNRFAATALEPQRGERHGAVPLPMPGSLVMMGWRGPAAREADGAALELISHLLTAGPSSRLNQTLVGAERPFLRTQGELDRTREGSLLLCMAMVRPGADSTEAETALSAEVEKLASQPVAESELEAAKRRLEATQLFQAQTARDRAQIMGTRQLLEDAAGPVTAEVERMRRVAPADLQRVAAKFLRPANRTVVWVGAAGSGANPSGMGGDQ